MTKALLGAAAAAALASFAFTGTAEAQCWWTKGYNLQCSVPSTYPSPNYVPPAAYPWTGGYPNYIYPYTGTYPPYWVLQR
jgi:hypothetical protein